MVIPKGTSLRMIYPYDGPGIAKCPFVRATYDRINAAVPAPAVLIPAPGGDRRDDDRR